MANVHTFGALLSVAIVDDDESTRVCLKKILQSAKNFCFAGSFASGVEALTGIPHVRPDLALMDIELPDVNGVECLKRLKWMMPALKVVMATGQRDAVWVAAALQAGAAAYLVKPFTPDQLWATLKFVAGNTMPFKSVEKPAETVAAPVKELPLNARERDVLNGLAQGMLYKEISDKLGISYAAVHKSQHKIFKKLGVSNRSEAIRVWLGYQGE
jgi:DNA-binding NarL/FixJ family response regulator